MMSLLRLNVIVTGGIILGTVVLSVIMQSVVVLTKTETDTDPETLYRRNSLIPCTFQYEPERNKWTVKNFLF